jgi:hypothetical protein
VGAYCPNCGKAYDPAKPASPAGPEGQGFALSPASIAAVVGGAFIAIGGFLPWITVVAPLVGTVQRSGVDLGDGIIAILIGVAVAIIGLEAAARGGKSSAGLVLVGLGLVAVIGGGIEVYLVNDRIRSLDTSIRDLASVGAGLWLILAGGAIAFTAGLALRSAQTPKSAGPDWGSDSNPPFDGVGP